MSRPEGPSGRGRDAEVDVELLLSDTGLDPGPDAVSDAGPDAVSDTGPDAVSDQSQVAAGGSDGAVVTGQALIGGRRARLLSGGAVVAVAAAVVGLLIGLDRAVPDVEPTAPPPRQPSGLVTTTTVPPEERNRVITVPPTPAPTTVPPGQFLLGRETGLWLFVGGDDTLRRVDLDTGEVVDYGLRAAPVVAAGPDLVVYVRVSGLIGWMPAAVPGQQPFAWKRGFVARPTEPGRLWVLDPNEDTEHPAGVATGYGSWELFDTGSATATELEARPGDLYPEVEQRRPSPEELPASVAALRPGPELSVRPDAIVGYAGTETDAGYRLVVDGGFDLLAAGPTTLLVRSCAGQSCELAWIDRTSGARLDPAPTQEPAEDVLWAGLVADEGWLMAYYPGGGSEIMELWGPTRFRLPAGSNPVVSDDGQWLAFQADGQVVVIDIAGGQEAYRLGRAAPDGPPGDIARPSDNGLLFVPRLS